MIEERAYPAPRRVLVILNEEQYPISFNDFVVLISNRYIQPIGATTFDGLPADAYVVAPNPIPEEPQRNVPVSEQ